MLIMTLDWQIKQNKLWSVSHLHADHDTGLADLTKQIPCPTTHHQLCQVLHRTETNDLQKK